MSVKAKAIWLFVALFVGGTVLNTLFSTYLVATVLGQQSLGMVLSVLIGMIVGFTSVTVAMNYYYDNKPYRY
jgi:F0F1-type ATP synthase assembly protein I